MPSLNLTDTGFALWRTWAADLRENNHYEEDARLLCRLLDLYEEMRRRAVSPLSATNIADGIRLSVEMLIGRMLTAGAVPPREAAILK